MNKRLSPDVGCPSSHIQQLALTLCLFFESGPTRHPRETYAQAAGSLYVSASPSLSGLGSWRLECSKNGSLMELGRQVMAEGEEDEIYRKTDTERDTGPWTCLGAGASEFLRQALNGLTENPSPPPGKLHRDLLEC